MARAAGNRDRILDAAEELFWQYGYHATSISDIAKRARLPKGSIYNYFSSKSDLLLQVLQKLRYQYETHLRLVVLEGTLSPGEIVARISDYYCAEYAKHGFGRGDPLGSRINELADTNPEMMASLNELAKIRRRIITQKIWAYATIASVPELIEHSDQLAGIIIAALQGMLVQMKAVHSEEPLLEGKQSLVALVNSYVNALATGEAN